MTNAPEKHASIEQGKLNLMPGPRPMRQRTTCLNCRRGMDVWAAVGILIAGMMVGYIFGLWQTAAQKSGAAAVERGEF